jgi:hypothetical protein
MSVFLAIEARQPNGAVIRVAAGWDFHSLAAWLAALGRLF